MPIPDSGVCAATGFAEESKLPLRMGLIRNHYVGRTFIQPQQSIRHFGVKVKLNPVRSILEGKRVVLVDDSIVRGTTSRKIVKMVRAAGASEVHLRISCPPTISPCFYGVDTPSRAELIAATHTLDEIRKYVGADTLAYLSLEGLRAAVGSGQQLVLHVVLHRRLSGGVPARRAGVPAARAESRRLDVHARCRRPARGRRARRRRRSAPLRPPRHRRAAAARRTQRETPLTPEQLKAAIDNLGTVDYAVTDRGRAHDPPRAGRDRRARADRGGRRATPTATSASARWCCCRASTIRGRTT